MIVDESLYGVEEPIRHLVDLIKDEEGLRALANVAPDPVLQLQLVLVHSFLVSEVDSGDEEVNKLASQTFGVEALGNEFSDIVLATAGCPVEAENEGLGRLPFA